jgi:hypothetical protein
MYLTYQALHSRDARRERGASYPEASYFLLAFLGACFFFGVNGFGGVFNIRRNTSSSLGAVDLGSFCFIARV